MRPLTILASASALLLALAAPGVVAEDLAEADAVAKIIAGPDFELLGLDGERHRLADARGKVLLVNFWATWCTSCRSEIPELNRLHAEQVNAGVIVLGVNYDGLTGEKLATLAQEMEIEFPVLVEDPRLRWAVEQPTVLPSTLIINPAGQVHQVLVGPQHLEDFARALGLDSHEDGG